MSVKKPNKVSRSVKNLERADTTTTWILVAQRTQAKLLEHRGKGKQLTVIRGFVNPAGELQTRELVSDRPGRVYGRSTGSGPHAAPASEQAHEHALTKFARDLASTIDKGVAKGSCDRIILAAEPHCLGKIKKTLGAQARKHVSATLHKDLFLLDNRKLFAKLEDVLR